MGLAQLQEPEIPQQEGKKIYALDKNHKGFNWNKLAFALSLPFNPCHTETMLEIPGFQYLNVDDVRRKVRGLVLDVDGTLLPPYSDGDFSPEVVEKLREVRDKMEVCVFSNRGQERNIFKELGIPVVEDGPPKPHPEGFDRAARHYLKLEPQQCAMVGDNILTDGGANRVGMEFILVDPIPGKERLLPRFARGYGRLVKNTYDWLYREKIPKRIRD